VSVAARRGCHPPRCLAAHLQQASAPRQPPQPRGRCCTPRSTHTWAPPRRRAQNRGKKLGCTDAPGSVAPTRPDAGTKAAGGHPGRAAGPPARGVTPCDRTSVLSPPGLGLRSRRGRDFPLPAKAARSSQERPGPTRSAGEHPQAASDGCHPPRRPPPSGRRISES